MSQSQEEFCQRSTFLKRKMAQMWTAYFICQLFLSFFLHDMKVEGSSSCPEHFIAFNDTRCFYTSNVLTTYHEAKKVCSLFGAELYMPDLLNYEKEGHFLFRYIYTPL